MKLNKIIKILIFFGFVSMFFITNVFAKYINKSQIMAYELNIKSNYKYTENNLKKDDKNEQNKENMQSENNNNSNLEINNDVVKEDFKSPQIIQIIR